MFEYHGWLTIRDSPGETDEEALEATITTLKTYLQQMGSDGGILGLRAINGAYQLWLSGLKNHSPGSCEGPVAIFKHVASVASGSYGVLHIWDDEDARGHGNEFRVFVLTRGELREHQDPFLSPRVPVIEDP